MDINNNHCRSDSFKITNAYSELSACSTNTLQAPIRMSDQAIVEAMSGDDDDLYLFIGEQDAPSPYIEI